MRSVYYPGPQGRTCSFLQGQGARSERKHSPANGDGYGVCPIVGTQLADDILNVKINGRFRNRQLIGDLFVAIAVPYQAQNFDLAVRQILLAHMLRKTGCNLRWNMASAGMDGTNDGEQFVLWHALEDVSIGSRAQCATYFRVSVGSRQDDDAGVRRLSPNGDKRIRSVDSRELKVHQSYVRPMCTELRDGFSPGRGLRDQKHVRLRPDDRSEPFAKDRVVFYAEDANRFLRSGHPRYLFEAELGN